MPIIINNGRWITVTNEQFVIMRPLLTANTGNAPTANGNAYRQIMNLFKGSNVPVPERIIKRAAIEEWLESLKYTPFMESYANMWSSDMIPGVRPADNYLFWLRDPPPEDLWSRPAKKFADRAPYRFEHDCG